MNEDPRIDSIAIIRGIQASVFFFASESAPRYPDPEHPQTSIREAMSEVTCNTSMISKLFKQKSFLLTIHHFRKLTVPSIRINIDGGKELLYHPACHAFSEQWELFIWIENIIVWAEATTLIIITLQAKFESSNILRAEFTVRER